MKKLLLLALLFAAPAFANTTTSNYSFNRPAVNDPVDEDLWGTLLNENFDSLDTILNELETDVTTLESAASAIPVGTVDFYAADSAPSLWLLGYGQAVSRSTYSSLFAVIGTTYGVGDGSTTFNVPDCRGRVIAGQDDMGGSSANRLTGITGGVDGDTLGGTGGEEAHTMTLSELVSHTHTVGARTNFNSTGSGQGASTVSPTTTLTTNSAGSSTPFNVVQPTLILNCIIYAGQ